MSSDLKESNAPGTLIAHKLDITKDDEVLAMFKIIKDNHGGVDVCVNNAGMSRNKALLGWYLQKYHPIVLCVYL